MTGLEVDMVVTDSLEALELYGSIFEVERIEVGDFIKGQNEVVLSIYGTRFHLMDENVQYQTIAPKPEDPKPIWFNIVVPDVKKVYEKAIAAGCTAIQGLNEMPAMGVTNAIFSDPFGYMWMINQIDKVVSFEERVAFFEKEGFERRK